jgi:glutamyl-tRNA synthetase
VAAAFARGYTPPGPDVDWFGQVRQVAADLGFAPNQKAYKKDPDAYPGSIREASQIIRVLITGTPRSPDLAQVAGALGPDEVLRRVGAVG